MAELSSEQLARYSRQVLLHEVGVAGQQQLLHSKVLVIGAGGLGAPAAIYLAAAGLGTIGIIDADIVDVSNLHRQIVHDDADVGRPKTTSARERLEAQNPDVTVVEHNVLLNSSNALDIFADYDVIVNGCDNFPTRYLVNDACVLLNKPLVDASILRFQGQMTVFLPGQGCYRCLFPEPPTPGTVPGCGEAGIIGALAGHMGTLQAVETVKLLLGIGTPLSGKMLLYDALNAEHRHICWQRDSDCQLCGDDPVITELIDYEAFCGITDTAADLHPEEATIAGTLQSLLLARGWAKQPDELHHFTLDSDVQWIDVREDAEWELFRIGGARHIPLGQFADRLGEVDTNKDAFIVCRSGERSAALTLALRQKGYSNIYNVNGGLIAWLNEGLPIERG